MAEIASVEIITKDGVVTATVVDAVSPDRIFLMLLRGSAAAQYARVEDTTPVVSREIKDLLIFPFTED